MFFKTIIQMILKHTQNHRNPLILKYFDVIDFKKLYVYVGDKPLANTKLGDVPSIAL